MDSKQKKLIRKAEQKDSRFYFLSDKDNLPRGTVCVAKRSDGKFARGVALCSLKTKLPDPQEGCWLAWKNAMRALNRENNNCPIVRKEARKVIDSFTSRLWKNNWKFRSQFDIDPQNRVEKKLFKELE